MSDRPRKLIGILLLFATVGVASLQALLVSCSSAAADSGSPPGLSIDRAAA